MIYLKSSLATAKLKSTYTDALNASINPILAGFTRQIKPPVDGRWHRPIQTYKIFRYAQKKVAKSGRLLFREKIMSWCPLIIPKSSYAYLPTSLKLHSLNRPFTMARIYMHLRPRRFLMFQSLIWIQWYGAMQKP